MARVQYTSTNAKGTEWVGMGTRPGAGPEGEGTTIGTLSGTSCSLDPSNGADHPYPLTNGKPRPDMASALPKGAHRARRARAERASGGFKAQHA